MKMIPSVVGMTGFLSLSTSGHRLAFVVRRSRLHPQQCWYKQHNPYIHTRCSTSSSSPCTLSASPKAIVEDDECFQEDFFLRQVEQTVHKVLSSHSHLQEKDDILTLPRQDREALGIARHLMERLQAFGRSQDCPKCWMQRAHCICNQCPPVPLQNLPLRRIFLVMHHKEIALKVDTAKLILAAFPQECRLVVAGIGPEYQDSMAELMEALQNSASLVLFPDENAVTYQELVGGSNESGGVHTTKIPDLGWDLIVLDGTWAQARKFYKRYFTDSPARRVQLSDEAVQALSLDDENNNGGDGHQLRRHVITWKQIGTFEATRLFLRDVARVHHPGEDSVWSKIQVYQTIANNAARRELGPPRVSPSSKSS